MTDGLGNAGDLLARLADDGAKTVRLCEPVDFILEKRLHAAAEAAGVDLDILDTPLFLTTRAENAAFFEGRKRYFMAVLKLNRGVSSPIWP